MTPEERAVLEFARDTLQNCDEAMHYMSEYDIPIMLPINVKDALKDLNKLLEETK